MNKNKILYTKNIRIFEDTMTQVKEAIAAYQNASVERREAMGITEADYIRLNRVIQLAYKYLPKQSSNPDKSAELSKGQKLFLELTKRFRGFNRKKQKEAVPVTPTNPVYNAYQMSEDLISTLRTLRQLDRLLSSVNAYDIKSTEEMLDATPHGNITNKEKGAPGILDDYRQGSWGVERICLDGMQNHLPSDSLGTGCWLHFLVDNKWVDATVASQTPEKITKVRFSDDGVGYFPFNLKHLHSTKSNELGSVGQFGEGMKLASMACVNLGLGLELQSRNWSAMAVGVEVESINTRNNNAVEKHKKLEYEITEYDGEPIKGSRTIFHTPTKEFIRYALQLPEKVLPLNHSFKYLYSSEHGDIVSTKKDGEIFVKGVFVKKINTFFSYNFDEAPLTPDRNEIIGHFPIEDKILEILIGINDIKIIKSLIAKVVEYQKLNPKKNLSYGYDYPIEIKLGAKLYYMFDRGRAVPSLWKEAFEQVFEQDNLVDSKGAKKKAILKTNFEVPTELSDRLNEYTIVTLPEYWQKAFEKVGIKTDRESLPDFLKIDLETSLTTSYGSGVWGFGQMLVDAAQNHFPSDSGGRYFFLRFQDDQGNWHDYSEIDAFDPKNIKKIKISDNGIGYDFERLALLNSGKDHSVTSGRWGEGLKMLTAVALRTGVKLEFRSRDWKAIPYVKKKTLDAGLDSENVVEQVAFEVTQLLKEDSSLLGDKDRILDEYGNEITEKSSTTFLDPSPALIEEFKKLKDKIILLQKKSPIASVGKTHVLDFYSGNIFVKNILIPNKHGVKYGYHFEDFDIEGRDRNLISADALNRRIGDFLGQVNSTAFITMFLRDAEEAAKGNGKFIEFNTEFNIPSGTKTADTWIDTFESVFGLNTGIRLVSDQDMNAVHMAQHVYMNMVTLPDNVGKALINLTGTRGQKITSYKEKLDKMTASIKGVPESDLSDYEKLILDYLKKISLEMLGKSLKISVFDYPESHTDMKALGLGGNGKVLIWREMLNSSFEDLTELLHVFHHEADHAITNAQDADIKFRDYLTTLLAEVTIKNFPLNKVLLDKLGKEKFDIIMGQLGNNWQPANWTPNYDIPEQISDEVKKGR